MKMGRIKGYKHSEETKIKMGKSRMGHITTEETKRKISMKQKGITNVGKIPWSYIDGRSKHPITRKKIRKKTLAHINWCEANNIHRVPDGCVIHHIDLNPENNNPENLQLLEDSYHRSLHNHIIKLMKAGDIATAI